MSADKEAIMKKIIKWTAATVGVARGAVQAQDGRIPQEPVGTCAGIPSRRAARPLHAGRGDEVWRP